MSCEEISQAEYIKYWNLSQQGRTQLLEDEQTPDLIRAVLLYQLGEQLTEKEEFNAAIPSYEAALDIKPDYYKAWRGKGNSLRRLQRYQEAIDNYDRAIEIKPDDTWAWAGRGSALAALSRYEEAISSYDKAVEVNSFYSWIWYERGMVLSQLNRYEDAISNYDRALLLEPDYYWVWWKRGEALAELNRYEEAVLSYEKLIEIKPDDYWGWIERADVLLKLKRYEEAVFSYDKALAQESNLKAYCNWRKREIITSNNKLLPYLTNRWARGKRNIWKNLYLVYSIFQFPIIFCVVLAIILFFQNSLLAQILKKTLLLILTGISILIIPLSLIKLKESIKISCKVYFRSGFLSYVRAFTICTTTIVVSAIVYTYSPGFLQFGWGQLVFNNSGNWGIVQPFEMANQAAETANTIQENLADQNPAISNQNVASPFARTANAIQENLTNQTEISNESRTRVNQFDFRWLFIPALWFLLILVLPYWAKWEEETYRKGIHTWRGITVNSVKFGLAHLIMGIPICWGLSLSVPGFLFACRYKYIYHQHLKKFGDEQQAQDAGVLASTADHAIYNAILVTLLTVSFLG